MSVQTDIEGGSNMVAWGWCLACLFAGAMAGYLAGALYSAASLQEREFERDMQQLHRLGR
jgi:F0F1-type ATP synthase membrane subunit c/vacuolar-type H+-ATPase subunit K